MTASDDVRHPMLPELYDRIDAFVQARCRVAEAARVSRIPGDGVRRRPPARSVPR